MIRFTAVAFVLAVATSAQAISPAPLHQPDAMTTQAGQAANSHRATGPVRYENGAVRDAGQMASACWWYLPWPATGPTAGPTNTTEGYTEPNRGGHQGSNKCPDPVWSAPGTMLFAAVLAHLSGRSVRSPLSPGVMRRNRSTRVQRQPRKQSNLATLELRSSR